MIIVYLSLTGNVRKFVEKTEMKGIELEYSNPFVEVNNDFLIIVPSYDDDITTFFSKFIEYKNNLANLRAVVGSGNRNFDKDFCFNAEELATKYNKPLILKFEFSGTEKEMDNFRKEVLTIEVTRTK